MHIDDGIIRTTQKSRMEIVYMCLNRARYIRSGLRKETLKILKRVFALLEAIMMKKEKLNDEILSLIEKDPVEIEG